VILVRNDEPAYERPQFHSVSERSVASPEAAFERYLGDDATYYGSSPANWNPYITSAYASNYFGGVDMSTDPTDPYRVPLYGIQEDESTYVVEIELPGADPESIDLEIGPDEVEVSTDTRPDDEGSRGWPFLGRLTLPESIEPEETKVDYEFGLLRITLAKTTARARLRLSVEGQAAKTTRPKREARKS
jgi:HSP20 family protein